jgi:levansucrase
MQSIVVIGDRPITKAVDHNMGIGARVLNRTATAAKTSKWTADHVAGIAAQRLPTIPLITAEDLPPILPGFDLWDLWPVQTVDGKTADFDGHSIWLILSAPLLPDPEDRHAIARIRMVTEKAGVWTDCGNIYPDGHCPGSREWAGSALYDPATRRLTSFHTAAGRRGMPTTIEQRMFQTSADLTVTGGIASVQNWTPVRECFKSDGVHYAIIEPASGEPGCIEGFRDPAHFRDPADGTDYMLFTGSLHQPGKHQSDRRWNGVVGIARSQSGMHDAWELLPPIVSAGGLCNELERPHIIFHGGLYYLFWSSQNKVFAHGGPAGPTALYGMVANSVLGPYRPLNGTGLVAANPAREPYQTYSWIVTDDLKVAGFIDYWGLEGRIAKDSASLRRSQFGGTPAPRFGLSLNGDSVQVAVV